MINIVHKFLENTNSNNIAIKTRNTEKSYKDFISDIKKVINYLEINKIAKESRALLLINMSYEMYVTIFASILYGLQVVIIDNFKDKKRVTNQIIDSKIDYVFTNNVTGFIKNIFKPLRKIKKINVQKILKQKEVNININQEIKKDRPCLITFTSGGTGRPKPVIRTLNDLEQQMNLTLNVLGNITDEYILATLPVYSLACLVNGLKIYIPFKKEDINKILKKEKPNVMFSSISKYLEINSPTNSIRKAFFGGSILYYNEALKIKKNMPNANITYIYGATEASIISKTTLDEYIKDLEENNLCLGNILSTNNVEIENDEIVVKKGIITNNYLNSQQNSFHPTKDLGYIKDNRIYITGRKISDNIKSDYILEHIVKKEFPDIFEIACLKINDEYHIFLEQKDVDKRLNIVTILQNHINNGIIHIVKKLPLDYRHHEKVDYTKLLKEENIYV